MNSKARFHLARYTCIISPMHGSALNTRSNDFIRTYIERVTSWVIVRGESGVAGEGRVVGLPKFHSWGKCTMPLTNINLDWMSNHSSGLWIILHYEGPLFRILGCNGAKLAWSASFGRHVSCKFACCLLNHINSNSKYIPVCFLSCWTNGCGCDTYWGFLTCGTNGCGCGTYWGFLTCGTNGCGCDTCWGQVGGYPPWWYSCVPGIVPGSIWMGGCGMVKQGGRGGWRRELKCYEYMSWH